MGREGHEEGQELKILQREETGVGSSLQVMHLSCEQLPIASVTVGRDSLDVAGGLYCSAHPCLLLPLGARARAQL